MPTACKRGSIEPTAAIELSGAGRHEVAARLRQDPVHCRAMLVGLTGWGTLKDQHLSSSATFDTHLTKRRAGTGIAGTAQRGSGDISDRKPRSVQHSLLVLIAAAATIAFTFLCTHTRRYCTCRRLDLESHFAVDQLRGVQ